MTRPPYRRPESVLVVIYTCDMQCLLLERVQPAGFWQSVTGSLYWDETPAAAARREVLEETGLKAQALVDARVSHSFTVLPHYLDQYEPGVTQNTEYVWYLKLPETRPVRLETSEHTAYCWLPWSEAVERVSSWTNREALMKLGES
jgi:dATP pyrophosphohydrolase